MHVGLLATETWLPVDAFISVVREHLQLHMYNTHLSIVWIPWQG